MTKQVTQKLLNIYEVAANSLLYMKTKEIQASVNTHIVSRPLGVNSCRLRLSQY